MALALPEILKHHFAFGHLFDLRSGHPPTHFSFIVDGRASEKSFASFSGRPALEGHSGSLAPRLAKTTTKKSHRTIPGPIPKPRQAQRCTPPLETSRNFRTPMTQK